MVPTASGDEIITASLGEERISVGKAIAHENQHFGFRHLRKDPDHREWITEIVGWHCGSKFLVGVHLSCQTDGVGVRVSDPKKPYIVRQILDELEGDVDGIFQVSDKPHFLDEQDIDVAKRVLTGMSKHYLPVVYVSTTWKNIPALDVTKLAQWTSGMAHIVVEPSRTFSFILADKVEKQNPYEGAISIHWPAGGGPPSRLFPYKFDDPVRFASGITKILRKALAGRRPDPQVTWDYVRELLLRDKIQRLRNAGTAKVEDYIAAFDEELKLTKSRVSELENENSRLKQTLASYENQQEYARTRGSGALEMPRERELFPGEVTDILVRALHRACENSQPDGRVRDVLTAFVKLNSETGESQRIEDGLRSAIANCNNLGRKERTALEDLGFSITEVGKHYKLVFRGDDRYTFSMPKTGSDWRGMKNWISDTTKRLFR